MKKITSIILCICLLLENIIFVIPVNALNDKEELEIVSVTQGNDELEYKDGMYIIKDYKKQMFLK